MDKIPLILDDIDKRIIDELQRDGRMPYIEIANKLGVSDGTIRLHTKRLIKRGILKISASINPFFFKAGLTALIGMKLERRTHKKVMENLLKLKGVLSAINAAGTFDLFVEVFFSSRDELNKFLMEELSIIEGIQATETFIYLDAKNKWIQLP